MSVLALTLDVRSEVSAITINDTDEQKYVE